MGYRPVRLFKYLPPERAAFLAKPMVRFTPPYEFNDPFDMLPTFGTGFRRLATRLWRESSGALYEKYRKKFESRAKFAKATLNLMKQEGTDEFINNFHSFSLGRLQKHLGDQMGVLSLAGTPLNLLMWAHYGRNHTGLVVEFDSRHEFFAQLDGDHVVYSLRRPVVRDGSEDALIFRKSREWSYEKEFRFIARADPAKNYLVPLPIEAVRAVFVGCRMSARHVNIVRRTLQLPGRHAIAAYRVTRNLTRFELNLQPL